MALWLWVTNLDPKNDWIELKSFSLGSPGWSGGGKVAMKDAHLMLDPGRFRMRLFNWLYKGEARTAYVFSDPQTEFQFLGAMASGISSSNDDVMSLSINFESVKVDYSGAP